MGGPWFAVHESGNDWQRLGSVWISNGDTDCQGVAEFKVEFVRKQDDSEENSDSEAIVKKQP